MKIVSIVGARPQFIKSAPVSNALIEAGISEYKIHTGQHYDYDMSQVFFEDLNMPEPSINLGIGSGLHGEQTGQMMIRIEAELLKQKPDIVLVYGDTNSTLAGALATAKLNIDLVHIEAGLRSYNRKMPEEINRVLTDHCSTLLFCPTQTAIDNLSREGINNHVYWVGDTMYDAIMQYGNIAIEKSTIIDKLNLHSKKYLLATIHRAYNTDNPDILSTIMEAFSESKEIIVFPIHPRTLQVINKHNIDIPNNIMTVNPLGYLDMLMLEQNARLILTDSGGMQKEAFIFKVPCLTLRSETEWTETVSSGWNVLVGADKDHIVRTIKTNKWPRSSQPSLFGDGRAAKNIVSILIGYYKP